MICCLRAFGQEYGKRAMVPLPPSCQTLDRYSRDVTRCNSISSMTSYGLCDITALCVCHLLACMLSDNTHTRHATPRWHATPHRWLRDTCNELSVQISVTAAAAAAAVVCLQLYVICRFLPASPTRSSCCFLPDPCHARIV